MSDVLCFKLLGVPLTFFDEVVLVDSREPGCRGGPGLLFNGCLGEKRSRGMRRKMFVEMGSDEFENLRKK